MYKLFIKFLEKLACKHIWKEIKKGRSFEDGIRLPVFYEFLYCCEQCGKFKKVKF